MSAMVNIPKIDSVNDLIQKGWSHHANGEEEAAEESFRTAISADTTSIEALYGLAMTLKSQGRRRDSIQILGQVIDLIDRKQISDPIRSNMLRRLTKAHIHQMESGDWDLEKEIWQRKN